jgi:hypothetical protein
MPFFLLLAFAFSANVDTKWIQLLHYEKGFSGSYHGRASSDNFYVSKERSPQAELDTFLVKFNEKPVTDDHVVCRFPMRAKYVVKKGYKPAVPQGHCPKYEKFKATLAPVGVSLIFSSYFLDSPASTFGHTFLRLRRNTPKVASEKQIELLDHGIGYAARPNTLNPLFHSILGLTGGFDGIFSLVPYYYKVREYNDFESRDLWSYELNMTAKEMEDLVDHIWEVGQATFPYYYLTENCSYYMLEILEVVTGRKLLERIPFWIIPVDSIKAVMQDLGFVKEITYRPSLKSQFEVRSAKLNSSEKKEIKTLEYKSTWSTLQIDTAIDYLDLKYAKDLRQPESEKFKMKDQLLRERAKRSESSVIQIETPVRPDEIHPSARGSIWGGYDETQKGYLQLEQRFAYYDPLDPPQAKPKFSEIIFLDLSARYYKESDDFDIQQTDLVRVKIRNPWTEWMMPFSYSFAVGGERDEILCDSCFTTRLHFDIGADLWWRNSYSLYWGFTTDIHASSHMDKGYGIYSGPLLEVIAYFHERLRLGIELQYLDIVDRDVDAFFEFNSELRWDLKQNLSLGLNHSFKNKIYESRLGIYYYY